MFAPSLSIVIAAFNEGELIEAKIKNSLDLVYPESKKQIIVICDGSNDDTVERASRFSGIHVLYQPERRGKMAAIDRAMTFVTTDIVVFTDANTMLNNDALLHLSRHFQDSKVGMVAGEKRVLGKADDDSAQGEGAYWKYESWLKTLDSNVSSVVGAAGELFAMRRELFTELPSDTILDDFMLSAHVLNEGFVIKYEPLAIATEYGSASFKEEWKRKVRIASGGIQSIVRSSYLFNPLKFGWISVAYTFHRVARWTLAPLAFLLIGITLFLLSTYHPVYFIGAAGYLATSIVTYFAVKFNWTRMPSAVRLPVYFAFMHFAVIAGWIRYATGTQSAAWDKAKRLA